MHFFAQLEKKSLKQKENIEVISKTRQFMHERENNLKKTAEELLTTLLPKAVKKYLYTKKKP